MEFVVHARITNVRAVITMTPSQPALETTTWICPFKYKWFARLVKVHVDGATGDVVPFAPFTTVDTLDAFAQHHQFCVRDGHDLKISYDGFNLQGFGGGGRMIADADRTDDVLLRTLSMTVTAIPPASVRKRAIADGGPDGGPALPPAPEPPVPGLPPLAPHLLIPLEDEIEDAEVDDLLAVVDAGDDFVFEDAEEELELEGEGPFFCFQ